MCMTPSTRNWAKPFPMCRLRYWRQCRPRIKSGGRRRSRHSGVRRQQHSSLARDDGTGAIPGDRPADDHGRWRRLQWQPPSAVEGQASRTWGYANRHGSHSSASVENCFKRRANRARGTSSSAKSRSYHSFWRPVRIRAPNESPPLRQGKIFINPASQPCPTTTPVLRQPSVHGSPPHTKNPGNHLGAFTIVNAPSRAFTHRLQRLVIKSARHLFSCSHGIIRDSSGQEQCALTL